MTTNSPYSLATSVEVVKNNFAIIVLVLIFFMGGFLGGSLWTENMLLKKGGLAQPSAAAGTAPAQPDAPPVGDPPALTDKDHVLGNKNAKVALITYGDFECEFTARFQPTLQKISQTYGDKVKLVYRHYPLPFHPNAQKAAEGSECVNKLAGNDAFWKYSKAIFAENDRLGGKLEPQAITVAAQAAGVNQAAFQTCLDSGEFASTVKDEMDNGAKVGVNGTPGSFILTADGKSEYVNGAQPFEQVKVMLDKYVN